MKVAICLSGESRTYNIASENIKNLFSESQFDFTYFGHTWSSNSWKIFPVDRVHDYEFEKLDIPELYTNLKRTYPFAKLLVSNHLAHENRYPWKSMSYSCMMSNHLKQEYEIENDMKFDLVVHYRYDTCRDPIIKFSNFIPSTPIKDYVLYSQVSLFKQEYRQQSINDIFYFGSSHIMDTIQSFYRIYHNDNFYKLTNTIDSDHMYRHVGCGVLLYKWATMKNIYLENIGYPGYHILRRNSKVKDIIKDFNELILETEEWGKK